MGTQQPGARHAFGIDIGGTGIKGAVVDLSVGTLVSERIRFDTPQPATVDAVLDAVERLLTAVRWHGPLGCAFPGVVKRGIIGSAANVAMEWLGVDLAQLLRSRTEDRVTVLNDADAAALAEMSFGAGRDAHPDERVILMLTLGTGIGSALITDGVLLPNTELGHLELDGRDAESHASAAARRRDGISFADWVPRLQRYVSHVERLFSPDLIIVGGGVIRQADEFLPQLHTRARLVPAKLRHNAGIVGAALAGAAHAT